MLIRSSCQHRIVRALALDIRCEDAPLEGGRWVLRAFIGEEAEEEEGGGWLALWYGTYPELMVVRDYVWERVAAGREVDLSLPVAEMLQYRQR